MNLLTGASLLALAKSIYYKKRVTSHRIGLEHQRRRRFFFLEQQFGRRDVMWKRYIKLYTVAFFRLTSLLRHPLYLNAWLRG